MTYAVQFTARALGEIDTAIEWLARRSRAAAVRWHQQLLEAVQSFAACNEAWVREGKSWPGKTAP